MTQKAQPLVPIPPEGVRIVRREGFAAPFVSVKRRSDGRTGLLEFKHSPRVYFDSRGEFA